ncbi:hypothetical protein BDZ97DRAFT_1801921, partial [Flammula alnicola]
MNFLDYEITRSPTPNPAAAEQPSLNEEVNQVIGQLGRFWGGFRKQSQTALETARKDFSEVVVQAQKELSKFTAADAPQNERDCNDDGSHSSSSSPQSLFSRLQSALPPNIVATHASENIDLQGIRANLLSELQRVQGVTLTQAEEYAHKSEALLREAVKEAGEVLRDAVKVVPPEQAETSAAGGSGLVWDGTDMWMFPLNQMNRVDWGRKRGRHDPGGEEGVKERYLAWTEAEVDKEPVDGQALKQLEQTLVPSEMTKSAFWLRFFFRTHQIRMEEEKRKALIRSSTDNDEDFSWEDEEEDMSPTTGLASSLNLHRAFKQIRESSFASLDEKSTNHSLIIPAPGQGTGGTNTPRVSSEDSFDLVSSSNASAVGDEKPSKRKDDDEEAIATGNKFLSL